MPYGTSYAKLPQPIEYVDDDFICYPEKCVFCGMNEWLNFQMMETAHKNAEVARKLSMLQIIMKLII